MLWKIARLVNPRLHYLTCNKSLFIKLSKTNNTIYYLKTMSKVVRNISHLIYPVLNCQKKNKSFKNIYNQSKGLHCMMFELFCSV